MAKEIEQIKVAGKPQIRVFIYTLADPQTGEVRYVGKALKLEQRIGDHCRDKRQNHKANWIRSLAKRGLKPIMEVLEETADVDWQDCEKFWIESLRFLGCKLTNLTQGGEGGDTINKPEVYERWASAQRRAKAGRKQAPELISKRVSAIKSSWGYKFSEKSKKKMSESAKQRTFKNPNSQTAQLANLSSYRNSEANSRNVSNQMRLRWQNPEWRTKMTNLWKGKHHTAESRAKMKQNHWRKQEKEMLA